MKDWLQEIRFAGRRLQAEPGFAFVAVLTLSIGIGANTAIYSLVQAILLRPLPFSEPDRLVRIWETAQRERLELRSLSIPALRDDWSYRSTNTRDALSASQYRRAESSRESRLR